MKTNRRRFLQWGVGLAAGGASVGYYLHMRGRCGVGEGRYGDLAIVDDVNFGGLAMSPDGNRIGLAGYDCTRVRVYAAEYPPTRLADYVKVAEVPNATYGVSAMAWCGQGPARLAFIVQQTRSYNFPRISRRAEFKDALASANLGPEDYHFVLYSVKADGTELRRLHVLEGGPINGRSREGDLIALAWPSATDLYYYLEGRITRVDLSSGQAFPFWEGGAGRKIRNLFVDGRGRIATLEYAKLTETPSLVFLDDRSNVVGRDRLADCLGERIIPYPLYGGGSVYVDVCLEDHVGVIRARRLGTLESVAALPDASAEWTYFPMAVTQQDREVICHAVTREEDKVSPARGQVMAGAERLGVRPSGRLLQKLARVEIS